MTTGLIIIDHGSRNAESNQMLEELAAQFASHYLEQFPIVEPAHMELADPTMNQAYARCVQRGATRIIVCPFFLGPGKHIRVDIPHLASQAAKQFPGTRYRIAHCLGIEEQVLAVVHRRASECLAVVEGEGVSSGK